MEGAFEPGRYRSVVSSLRDDGEAGSLAFALGLTLTDLAACIRHVAGRGTIYQYLQAKVEAVNDYDNQTAEETDWDSFALEASGPSQTEGGLKNATTVSARMPKIPEFQRWGGPPWTWSFGWWTGKDRDLMCVVPELAEGDGLHRGCLADLVLSPVCKTRIAAFIAFCLKWALVQLDENTREGSKGR